MAASAFRVLLKSPFSQYSGYGHDGFELLRALHHWGADVYAQPTWLDVPIPGDLLPLFGKPLEAPFDLTICHWDPSHLAITREARQATRLAVAWSMWEMTSLSPHCKGRSHMREQLRWFDAFLGYSDVTMQAMEPYLPRTVARGVLQGGYEPSEWKYMQRDWAGDRFMYCMHGALNRRKEPFLTLQAFLELCDEHPEFKEHARLAFHTTVPGVFPEMNEIYEKSGIGVRVFMEVWDKPVLDQFYQAAHCYICPSHGEGKNLPALEFASTGGAVIVTNWSGHTNWLSEDIGYGLDYELRPMFPDKPDQAHWAVVSIVELKAKMWHVFTHREEAKAKGERAAQLLPQMCSWDTVVESLFRRLRDMVPVQGEIVQSLAMSCRRDQEARVPDGH